MKTKETGSLALETANVLRETRRLKQQMLSFRRSAVALMRPLSRAVTSAEIEAMVTPRANALGTLENLHYQDLRDFLRQLSELEGNLRHVSPEL